ncbi:MAG: pyruvate formate lyase-activating protein [Roseofilum sp. SBFL]|uniref:pyruvate formate-lyase-activating protein n=1 Tax=unclassified Roseofilum TaxID=2620099 RepID=UPI001B083F42|nr:MULTISPECIES: pyruvate formate-lyase-activating protein [unclassified Roseofilum]MBP0012668.1 pyruvate formate lyase-activating protein [Roseofilum sp. SID3]MBP0023172.1 pyruvate formate lyase-activating protein [Roseofilum sp. SID2]MBP0039978.1 pyruvate formate lyase-activating protein [Roseofilum sp. SID1]MBP0042323.1 pyruvate formate lyase-activating protein [Roseofilum sp. SBFL]
MGSTGIIHSIETCGTVDGPGIRFVIFTKGCPLRCLYCHNPDSRCIEDGEAISVDELMVEIEKYRSYFQFSGGGVTVTGGEPLMQPEFVKEIFQRCRQIGVHTALDTSGYINVEMAKSVLDYTDLVLLDIKSFDPQIYKKVTHVSIEPTLDFARYLNKIQKPTWIRFVLVPGLTDAFNNVNGLAEFVALFENVEKVEILPFHKMGEYKWQQLGYDYQLKNTEPPSQELLEQTIGIFKRHNLVVQ